MLGPTSTAREGSGAAADACALMTLPLETEARNCAAERSLSTDPCSVARWDERRTTSLRLRLAGELPDVPLCQAHADA